jgi:hypothetical protein
MCRRGSSSYRQEVMMVDILQDFPTKAPPDHVFRAILET